MVINAKIVTSIVRNVLFGMDVPNVKIIIGIMMCIVIYVIQPVSNVKETGQHIVRNVVKDVDLIMVIAKNVLVVKPVTFGMAVVNVKEDMFLMVKFVKNVMNLVRLA